MHYISHETSRAVACKKARQRQDQKDRERALDQTGWTMQCRLERDEARDIIARVLAHPAMSDAQKYRATSTLKWIDAGPDHFVASDALKYLRHLDRVMILCDKGEVPMDPLERARLARESAADGKRKWQPPKRNYSRRGEDRRAMAPFLKGDLSVLPLKPPGKITRNEE